MPSLTLKPQCLKWNVPVAVLCDQEGLRLLTCFPLLSSFFLPSRHVLNRIPVIPGVLHLPCFSQPPQPGQHMLVGKPLRLPVAAALLNSPSRRRPLTLYLATTSILEEEDHSVTKQDGVPLQQPAKPQATFLNKLSNGRHDTHCVALFAFAAFSESSSP